MQANVSDMLMQHRIPMMDLASRYRKICSQMGVASQNLVDPHEFSYMRPVLASSSEAVSRSISRPTIRLSTIDIEDIAFMVAYLLVLLIGVSLVFHMLFSLCLPSRVLPHQGGPTDYIADQIAAIKDHVLHIYPVAASVHAVHYMIIPVVVSLFLHPAPPTLPLNDHGCVDSVISRLDIDNLPRTDQPYILLPCFAFAKWTS